MQSDAELAVGQRLARLGIDDLHDERVLEDVQPVVRGHSTETHCTSWKPYESKHSTPNVASSSSRSPMFGSARMLEVGRGVVAHLARDVGEAEQVVAGGEDRGRRSYSIASSHLPFAAGDVAGAGRDDDAVEPAVERLVEHPRAVVRAVAPTS